MTKDEINIRKESAIYSLILDEIILQEKQYSKFGIDDIANGLDMTKDEILKFIFMSESTIILTELGKKCSQILEELGKHE